MGIWRMVLMPLMLVLLMIFRPRGIMGLREFSLVRARPRPLGSQLWRKKREEARCPFLRSAHVTHYFGGLCAVSDFNLDPRGR